MACWRQLAAGPINGGTPPFTWAASALPPGMTLSPAGVLSGIPALGSQGTYTVRITIRDSSVPQTPIVLTTRSLVIALAPPLSITEPSSLPPATVGGAYGPITFAASGGTGDYTWSAASLPNGLNVSGSTGILSGTPTASGTPNLQFCVKDSSNATACRSLVLTINPPALQITGLSSLPPGTIGIPYGPVPFAATGGTGSGYTWSATALPAGLNFIASTGALSGTPTVSGTPIPQFCVKDSGNTSFCVRLPLTIYAAGCASALSPGGQGFTAAGGSGSVAVVAPAGCAWSLSGGPSWVNISGSSGGSGNGTIAYQVVPNSGPDRSASMTVAGLRFNVEQASANISGLTGAGSLAHITSAGSWTTTFTYVNNGANSAQTRTNFFDGRGDLLALPLTFPQLAAGSDTLMTPTLDRALNPGASLIFSSTGPDADPQQVGWGQLQATGNVGGFAIFSDPSLGWNAVVPLETRNAPGYLLTYDNMGVLATGLAIANLSTQPAAVNVVIRDDLGVIIGTSFITLPAQGHTSFMLTANYPVTFNKRGTVEFGTPPGGQISVLGLRANGPALTTLPVLANVTAAGGSLTHATYNGGFTTQFTLVNTGSFAAQATLSFFDNSGNPLNAPLFLPQTATTLTATTLTRTLVPGASLLIQTQGQDALPAIVGSAQLTTSGPVSGFAIFNWTTFGQEASVPLETRNANSYVLAFDNTNGLATGLALSNVTSQSAKVTVVLRDDTGAQLQATNISLPPNGHTSFLLADNYAVTANKRGTIEFDTPSGGRISALGLRAKSDGSLTTIPVLTDAPVFLQISAPTSLLPGMVLAAYGPVTFTASAGTGTGYTWSAAGLPAGMSINSSTGVLAGTPTTSGSFNPRFTVKDSGNDTTSVTLGLTVNSGAPLLLQITGPSSLPTCIFGAPSYGPVTFTASGGAGPYIWTATGLPAGLSISQNGTLTGSVSSIPLGNFNPRFTVTDSTNATATITLGLVVTITTVSGPSTLPSGNVGAPYGPVPFTASGGTAPYTFAAQQNLPTGLSFSAGGVLSGTPAAGSQGSYVVSFAAADANGWTSYTAPLTLVINPAVSPLIVACNPTLPLADVGWGGTIVNCSASGGTSPYHWSVGSGALPPGFSLSATDGTAISISGTATTVGIYSFLLKVTDSNSPPATTLSQSLGLTVVSQTALNCSPLTGPTQVGVAYSVTCTASGGQGAYIWTLPTLPAGLSFPLIPSNTLTINGTPTQAGSYSYTVKVQDDSIVGGTTPASRTFSGTIQQAAGLHITSPASLPPAALGAFYGAVVFSAIGGDSSTYTWSATGLPAGFSMSQGGFLAGNPSFSTPVGSFSAQFTVKDSTNATASVTLTLVVTVTTITGPPSLSPGTVGVPYGPVTFTPSGGTAPYTLSANGTLPNGLSLSAGGVLSGTPASGTQGTYATRFTATDVNGFPATILYTLVIN